MEIVNLHLESSIALKESIGFSIIIFRDAYLIVFIQKQTKFANSKITLKTQCVQMVQRFSKTCNRLQDIPLLGTMPRLDCDFAPGPPGVFNEAHIIHPDYTAPGAPPGKENRSYVLPGKKTKAELKMIQAEKFKAIMADTRAFGTII